MVNKLSLDSTGRFAWAFAGAKPSLLAAGYLQREFENGIAEGDLERTLRNCADRGWRDAGLGGKSTLVLVDGKSKRIFRATLAVASMVCLIEDGRCFTGFNYSKASFFPQRYYSPDMSVDEVSLLAAYAVLMAGDLDPLCVAGLDMAIYRDSVGRFEFADRTFYEKKAAQVDQQIRQVFL